MANAAIYLNPEAFDTSSPTLMGRHSAGEGFLKGFLQHAEIDAFHFWNVANRPTEQLDRGLRRLAPIERPITWIPRADLGGLRAAGCVSLPSPRVGAEAWARRSVGERAYSICGVTHTTASAQVMDAVGELMTAPTEPWDALICTSSAVRASVETQLEALGEHLKSRFGATRTPAVRLETIPLGLDTALFEQSPEARRDWRDRLGIPEDAVVALYVGRFNANAKMHPVPMAIALERAAQRAARELHWVVSGWAASEKAAHAFHNGTRMFCPSLKYHVVDGRAPETRFSIWAVADLFISLSDNIQETFGLTPVEAMAAGLPSVVSDWDGYRDTVRHGIDGFRVSTYAPKSGLGRDLAFRHAQGWDGYETYAGATAQFTSIDIDEATQCLVDLIRNPDMRRSMGDRAREQARRVFDWKAIIPRYQDLWRRLAELRSGATTSARGGPPENPARMDPYRLFASYPTETLTLSSVIAPGAAGPDLIEVYFKRLAGGALPSLMAAPAELARLVATVQERRQILLGDLLAGFPAGRRTFLERSVLWLCKYGFLSVVPRAYRFHNAQA